MEGNYNQHDKDKLAKKKKEFEKSKFLAVFNCSDCADRQKDKSNHHFPSIVKIIEKKA